MPRVEQRPDAEGQRQQLAKSYGRRTIETMFQELTETLTCEIIALGYPKAALFGFCLALMAYDAVAVMKAALRAVHGHEAPPGHLLILPYLRDIADL